MSLWLTNRDFHNTFPFTLLFVAVILAVYYPALFSGIQTIDDSGIISLYSASPPLSHALLPGNGYYYRPLVELSFWFDNRLWAMEPVTMHLENILLHCVNSLLVFQLSSRMSDDHGEKCPLIPMLAALLFALHPVNVEAVSWIAGRTDPLLTLFVLSSCWFWLRWLDDPRWQDMVITLVLLGFSLLTKETAIAVGAVIFLLALVWPGTVTIRQRTTAVGFVLATGLLLIVFALLFRSGTSGLNRFVSGTDLQLVQVIWEALIAFGFYARKLVVPVPLNFAITEVHPVYGLLGMALLPVLFWCFLRRRLMGVLFISAALFVLPAVLIAVIQIAWTPFAERYLYLPSAFCGVGLSVLVQSGRKQFRGSLIILMLLVLTGFAFISVQRVMLWSNKMAFIQDAIAKSPDFGSLYNELGGLLLQCGEAERAADAFAAADRLNKRPSMRLVIKANVLGVQYVKGNYLGVRKLFFEIFKDKHGAPAEFLELLYKADFKRLNMLSDKDKILLAEDLLETLDLLNKKRNDPFWLYQSGKFSLIVGDKVKAAEYFYRSYLAAPLDAHYRGAAETYFRRLGRPQ